jgi:hypothetical protein
MNVSLYIAIPSLVESCPHEWVLNVLAKRAADGVRTLAAFALPDHKLVI